MDPVTGTALASAAATAGETAAAAASAMETGSTAAAVVEGTKVAAEVSEGLVGEAGLLEQLNTIRHASLESVAARNEMLLRTRNSELAGGVHPETGVPFVKDVVQLADGTLREGVFPEFSATFETTLPDDLLQATDFHQSQHCNEQLRGAVEADPTLKAKFSDTQLQQVGAADTPEAHTWHHHQETGRMQLVDSSVHLATGHTGGKEVWGGGRLRR